MRTLTRAAVVLALATPAFADDEVAGADDIAGIVDDVTLQVNESERYGEYLAVATGMSEYGRPVYVRSADVPRTEDQEAVMTCRSDMCLRDWTPVSGGVDAVGEGVDLEMVGTIAREVEMGVTARADAAQVILYNGWPLYHYEMDQTPMTDAPVGHGEEAFGAVWSLISPEGEPILD